MTALLSARLKTSVRIGAGIGLAQTSRLQDLSPVYRRKVVGLIRQSVGKEYANQAFSAPSGAEIPWRPTKRFGRSNGSGESLGEGLGSRKPLIKTGRTFRGWMGQGPGAVVDVKAKTVSVGVDLGLFPGERYLRGGTGGKIFPGPYISKAKKKVKNWQRWKGGPQQWAQWWFLFFKYGVTLSKATMERGLWNYARPHGYVNPLLRSQIRRSVERYVLTGRVS